MSRRFLIAAGVASAVVLSPTRARSDGGSDRGEAEALPYHVALLSGRTFMDEDTGAGNPPIPAVAPRDAVLLGLRLARDVVTWAPTSVIAPRLSVEAEGILTLSSVPGPADTNRSVWAPFATYGAHAVLSLFSSYPIQPLLLAGGGGRTLFTNAPALSHQDTDLVGEWGGGVRLGIGRTSMRVDYRQTLSRSRTSDLSIDHSVILGLGVHFGFSASRPRPAARGPIDFDADGLIGNDECPRAAEDEDGFQDQDGCPDIDNDGDRIADVFDQCPDVAETVNCIDDMDGCPEEDPDHDGLTGSSDSCPTDAEDQDGFQDEDGCPDPDNDGDAIPDATDKCPDAPETVNQYMDDDGCPDTVPKAVEKFTGTIAGIQFRTGTARIQLRSYAILNEAVQVLKDNPSIKLEIQGHTDSVGSSERNLELSQQRATAVLDYLTAHGIEASRLSAAGYGETRPIADNRSAAGRARNRRVDFVRR